MKSKLALLGLVVALICPSLSNSQAKQHSVTLSWTAGLNDVTFNVYRATTSGGYTTTPLKSGVTTITYVDTTGVGGTKYFYVVTGVDASGFESGFSNETSATFLASPVAPAGLTAVSN
jgi:fibronectin type 3 domain-containing protein